MLFGEVALSSFQGFCMTKDPLGIDNNHTESFAHTINYAVCESAKSLHLTALYKDNCAWNIFCRSFLMRITVIKPRPLSDIFFACFYVCTFDCLCSYIFYSILFYSILFYSILFYSILFYSILFCSVLFCSVLFCSVLFCSVHV